MSDAWKTASLDPGVVDALSRDLPATTVWSLLMRVMADRARREPVQILEQWKRDGFTAPAAGDQRVFVELDRHLLASASSFEAIEFSPLAPLGACSAIALTAQNRVVSALRGCEVVSDPTNVMALECARRLQEHERDWPVRLATVQRCVRAQPFPKLPGFAAHFRLFCLATGTRKGANHDGVVEALIEQIRVLLGALGELRRCGYDIPEPSVNVLATPDRASLAERICAALGSMAVPGDLQHRYYDGLRFTIIARAASGAALQIADGGAFDWLTRLTSNRKLSFIASGLGTQQLVHAFRTTRA